jgi:hypothetical protein
MGAYTKLALGTLAIAAALSMAGCAARAKSASSTPAVMKPAAPVPPPTPVSLSTPQTQVQLPAPQPIDPLAWEPARIPQIEANAPKPPAPKPTTVNVPPPRPARTDANATPAAPPATEPARPAFQEVIPANDLKRLQDSVANRKKEVEHDLEQVQKRHLNKPQQIMFNDIRGLMKLCLDYERRNEWPQADTMAERAQILVRQLLNGK